MQHRPEFADFVNLDHWYRLQDHLCRVLGMPLRTFDLNREFIVNPSWPLNFPVEQAVERLRMGDEVDTLIPRGEPLSAVTSLTTVFEVTYSVVPLSIEDETVAYFLVGPMVLGQRGDEQAYCERMHEMGLEGKMFWSLLLNLKSFTYAGSHGVLRMLECVGNSLLGYAYKVYGGTHRKNLESDKKDRMLRSLLQAASMATQADGGSIMVYNSAEDALTIRMAEGLSESVIRDTRVRRGEGLAGWAASQSKVRLLDDAFGEPLLRDRMRRSEIVSSLIAPLRTERSGEAYGVLNLRTTDPAKRFNQSHVDLLERLIELAHTAEAA